jgi:hypothetical protein
LGYSPVTREFRWALSEIRILMKTKTRASSKMPILVGYRMRCGEICRSYKEGSTRGTPLLVFDRCTSVRRKRMRMHQSEANIPTYVVTGIPKP